MLWTITKIAIIRLSFRFILLVILVYIPSNILMFNASIFLEFRSDQSSHLSLRWVQLFFWCPQPHKEKTLYWFRCIQSGCIHPPQVNTVFYIRAHKKPIQSISIICSPTDFTIHRTKYFLKNRFFKNIY